MENGDVNDDISFIARHEQFVRSLAARYERAVKRLEISQKKLMKSVTNYRTARAIQNCFTNSNRDRVLVCDAYAFEQTMNKERESTLERVKKSEKQKDEFDEKEQEVIRLQHVYQIKINWKSIENL